ncbi:hypothetical protein [Cysteiniphilum marinum]|uniref:hypothetical protein n=1 Tax=Cysteiniphilum marinum TaxID=2774191 RepID=UPI001939F27B|nr:hypothetical protein [Cysteiniphilum marinum]
MLKRTKNTKDNKSKKNKLAQIIKAQIILGACLSMPFTYSLTYAAYESYVPTAADSPLYYSIGGGDLVPAPPSMKKGFDAFIGIDGAHYNCGNFNENASVANSLNGLKNTAMSMFNDAVNSAKGMVMSMPAYLIAKANPQLYQLLQNGLDASLFDFDLGLKSCSQQMADINKGNNPYQEMYNASAKSKWLGKMESSGGFGRSNIRTMTYRAATETSITEAKKAVDEDNGTSGVSWTHGEYIKGEKKASGAGQPPIKLTYDTAIAGFNTLLGESDAYRHDAIPEEDSLSNYWSSTNEAADWAVAVLGDRSISISGGNQSSAGKSLLYQVQKEYEVIFEKMVKLITKEKELTIDNLKEVSTDRLMISPDIIKNLQTDTPLRRSMMTSALAQGVAALKVVAKAQQLILALQISRNVAEISTNKVAQESITHNIEMLESQIQQIINNNENNKKLLTSTINNMMQARGQYVATGNADKSAGYQTPQVVDGVITVSE